MNTNTPGFRTLTATLTVGRERDLQIAASARHANELHVYFLSNLALPNPEGRYHPFILNAQDVQ